MTLASSARPGRLARFASVSILLAIYYVMAVSAVSQKSMTFDEMAHLTAGYTYWPTTTTGCILRTGTGRSASGRCPRWRAASRSPGSISPRGPRRTST